MDFRNYLLQQGLHISSVNNYCNALFDSTKSNHTTAKNWYAKYLETQSDQPFIQYLLRNDLSFKTATAYSSGVNNPSSFHHNIGMKWYKKFIESTQSQPVKSTEIVKTEEPITEIVKIEENTLLELLGTDGILETIKIIVEMNDVTDKTKLAMIDVLL